MFPPRSASSQPSGYYGLEAYRVYGDTDYEQCEASAFSRLCSVRLIRDVQGREDPAADSQRVKTASKRIQEVLNSPMAALKV